MILEETTSFADSALPLEPFKAHLKLGTGFSVASLQDAVLTGFLRAAVSAIEGRTGKVLLARNFICAVERWDAPDQTGLPVAPITSVLSVELEDAAGLRTLVDPALYRLVPEGHEPRLRAQRAMLPMIAPAGRAVIAFRAGYGDGWDSLPADLSQAVMLLAAHYYEHREETALTHGCMPFGVTSLIARYRVIRSSIGAVK